MKLMRVSLVAVMVGLGAMGCGGSEAQPETPQPVAPPPVVEKASESEAKPEVLKYDVDFVEAKESPGVDKPPRVTIDVPGFNQFVASSLIASTRIRYKVQGWNDAPEGSYLQFVLDGKPYRPVTDPKEQVMLTDLAGSEELTEGEHIIAAFMNRPNHESIKSERGIAVRRFFVGKRIPNGWNSNKDPLLVVGSPHGVYSSDVLVDWYVLNASMSSSEYSVRAVLEGPGVKPEGIQRLITEWKPWVILSAHDGGQYTLKLDLLDPSGEPVEYGSVARTFTVKRE